MFSYQNSHLSDLCRVDQNGDVVPAMPNSILACSTQVIQEISSLAVESVRYYDISLVARYDVRSVPLKIDGERFADVEGIVNHARSKMAIVHPLKLVGKNIGSNRGLISVIRDYYNDYNMSGENGDCERYLNINVDENIYWRILKVMYSH